MNNKPIYQSENFSDYDLEDLRIAYQTLPQMIAYEGQKSWNALSVFIQLAFVLAAGAIAPRFLPEKSSDFMLYLIGALLSLMGLLASLIWISLDARYSKIINYWVLSAKEVEENLSKSLIAFQRGKEFSEGNVVVVSGKSIEYKKLEKLPVKVAFKIIYFSFSLVFILLLVFNLVKLFATC